MSYQATNIVNIAKTDETTDDNTNLPIISAITKKRGRPKKIIDESEAKLIKAEKLRAVREERAKLKQEKISKKESNRNNNYWVTTT